MSERVLPPRPPFPASLAAAAAGIISIRMALTGQAWHLPSMAVSGIAGAGIAYGLSLKRMRSCRPGLLAAVFLIAWAAYGASGELLSRRVDAMSELLSHTPISSCELTTVTDPRCTEHGWTTRALIMTAEGDACEVTLSSAERIDRGRSIRCVGRFSPNEDEFGASQRIRGIAGSVRVRRIMSCELAATATAPLLVIRERLVDEMEPSRGRARALLAALVLGSREQLAENGADEELQRIGLAHLIAVSGTHLAILASIVGNLLEESELSSSARRGVLAAITLVFALLTGGSPSTLRSWAMVAARLAGEGLGRASRGADGVGLAACTMIALRPQLSGELGFLLSVVCVSSLCLLGPYAAYACELIFVPRKLPGFIPFAYRRRLREALASSARALSASILALVVCLPLTIPLTNSIPLIGPIACVLVTPLFSASMLLGIPAVVLSGLPVIGDAACFAAAAPCSALIWLSESLCKLPYSAIPATLGPGVWVVSAGTPILCYLLWPELSRSKLRHWLAVAASLAAATLISWRFFAPSRLVVLDIGQGDAILIQDGAHAVLVDTGPDDALVSALARQHVLHLDAVIITHLHDDHYGGLDEIAGLVDIDRVFVAEGASQEVLRIEELAAAHESLGIELPEELSYGDRLNIGGFKAEMVWPREPVTGLENSHSIELLVTCEDKQATLSALLTGDAEQDETARIASSGDAGDIDVLKVGHHGSAVSIAPETADLLSAELALVSAGEHNDYGHPSPDCVDVLERAGSRVLTTFEHGDISVYPGRKGPRISCAKGCG